jgi:hypothetical protein
VIAVLLAASRIASAGLQMTSWIRAYPYISISGRYRQLAYAIELAWVRYGPSGMVVIDEAFASTHAPHAGLQIADVDQADGPDFLAQ